LTNGWLLCLKAVPTLRSLQLRGVDNHHTSVDEALLELVRKSVDQPLFEALESLDVSKTGISGRALFVLAPYLTGLQSLDISRTHVTGDELTSISGLTNLQSLSLESLLLNSESFKVFAYLTNMRCLDLTDTHISVRSISLLAPLRQLEILHLCPSSFKFREGPIDSHMAVLQHLTSLKLLNVTGAQMEGDGLVHLTGLTRLETIFLYQTSISTHGLTHLANLKRLHTLELGNCAHLDADVLTRLPHVELLRSLDLSWLQIADPSPLNMFRDLQFLDLSYNTELTSKGLEQVTQLKSLHTINLWYCPKLWSLECFAALKVMKWIRSINIEHWKHVHVRKHLPHAELTDSL
jgi:Leucine-rich repeat (LRR) protein